MKKTYKSFLIDINGTHSILSHDTLAEAKNYVENEALYLLQKHLKRELQQETSIFYTTKKYSNNDLLKNKIDYNNTKELAIN